MRLGWQPLGGGSAAINMVMMRDKLFEKAAERLGYTITTEWKPFTAGPPLNEAMLSGLARHRHEYFSASDRQSSVIWSTGCPHRYDGQQYCQRHHGEARFTN